MSTTLHRAAESRLRGSELSELHKIRCTSRHNCTLTLHGKVSSFFLRQEAQELIKELEGLVIIDNQIEVELATVP
jgi:hypothetical protein